MENKQINLKNLILNTSNPRILPCKDQLDCVLAIYNSGKTSFITLINNIINKGFYQGENILVTRHPEKKGKYIVQEGNRRISALKLLHGESSWFKDRRMDGYKELVAFHKRFSAEFQESSEVVPCLIFESGESEQLHNEISSRHGSDAGRDPWPPISRAKFDRDSTNKSTPELELIERYFAAHKEKEAIWTPTFPLTILKEYMQGLSDYLGYADPMTMAMAYPDSATKDIIDDFIQELYEPSRLKDEIRKTPVRRENHGLPFISRNFPAPQGELDSTPKEKPQIPPRTSGGENPQPSPKPPKQRKVTPTVEKAQEIAVLCAQIPNSKLQLLASENCALVTTKLHLSCAQTLVLRTLFDCAAQALCKAHGALPNGSAPMLGKYIETITNNKILSDQQMLNLLAKSKNTSLQSLNTFIHSSDFYPALSDIKANYDNVQPIIAGILKDLISFMKQKSQVSQNKLQSQPEGPTEQVSRPLDEHDAHCKEDQN